tara:strand:+ start:1563 stop:2453 length:891 start_codon:yes stop_codon:yes gene_type:complete
LKKFPIICFLFLAYFGCDDFYNQGNEISAIIANVDSVKAGLEVYLKCIAKDQDNDKLSYNWKCSSGTLEILGDSAIWTAPLFEGIYFITCTVFDQYGASSAESIEITVTPASAVPVNGLEWELADEGLVAGPNTSDPNNTGVITFWDGNIENAEYGWNVTAQVEADDRLSQTLQFRVEDSQNCEGPNPNTQTGTATANIQIEGDSPVTLDIDFSGYGEAQSAGYDLIKFSLNGDVIGDGQAPGGGLGCESAPVTVNAAELQTLEPGPHTLVIEFTTNDAQYHVDAYYEIELVLIAP